MLLTEILNELGVDYKRAGEHHHATEGRISIDCPHCSPNSHRYRLGIHETKYYASCWTCGSHSFLSVLTELGMSYGDAIKILADREDAGAPIARVKRPRACVPPPRVGKLLPAHKRYLTQRGYDWKQLVSLYGLGGFGAFGRLKWRIFIPIMSEGRLVSWTTRAIGSNPLRYITAAPHEESHFHKDLLYGEELAKHAISIHEGPFDVWRIGPGAVCTFGVIFTRAQVLKMSKYPLRVVVFDKDAQGRARQLCSLLEVFPGKTLNFVSKAKDMGEADEREADEVRSILV